MTKKTTATETESTVSTPMDVAGPEASALAAAYDGLYHLFGARVSNWLVTEDGLVAEGFTVVGPYKPETILHDISRKDRRAPLWPTIRWIMDPAMEPPHFKSNLDITTFMVQFFKGSVEAGTSRSPEYVRKAAGAYKDRTNTRVKRGPKVRTIQLKNVREINVETLSQAGLSREDIQYLIDTASETLAAIPVEAPVEPEAILV